MRLKITIATLTCPGCQMQTTHAMPTNACLVVLRCRHCDLLIEPKPGDCCVFCSYGDVPCPPMQPPRTR
ncbi:MAG TPA: GDCCVxC domain-containing (seleno)protein [Roseiflexaceae bacterium]|nr:GDCCVxC domain-containing (seleno)protein [Roseiflexaceae bacterium]